MNVAVIFLGTPNFSTSRALPKNLRALEASPGDALAAAAKLDCKQILFVEPEAVVGPHGFASVAALDPQDGILGGCAVDASGGVRLGAVFTPVPYGPYRVEAFPLGYGPAAEPPAPEAIDAVTPGVYLVDREGFVAEGGFDAILALPWRVYDLCARFRRAGRAVRWDRRLSFGLEAGVPATSAVVDQHAFMLRWKEQLANRFERATSASSGVRRAIRLPLGQRDTVTIAAPPVDVVHYGEGAIEKLRSKLRTRSDRYLVLVDAAEAPDRAWLERMLTGLESAPNLCAVREPHRTIIGICKLPLDVQPPADAFDVDAAIDGLLEAALARGRAVRWSGSHGIESKSSKRKAIVPRHRVDAALSVVYIAQSLPGFHHTSFEGVYAGDLGVDYHVVATPSRPETIKELRTYKTLDVIVDDSAGMVPGVNAAMSRAQGKIVVVIGDDFVPPHGWLSQVREAFSLRPDMGILGFSAVFVDGPQCVDAGYLDMNGFRAYAQTRRTTMARDARLTDRLAATAFAVDAGALAVVGGFDEQLGAGRWGIEDLTLRMRAAGYSAYIADDLFLHHFTFNEAHPFLNEPAAEARRAGLFAKKWGIAQTETATFDPRPLIARGFDPQRDSIPLRDVAEVARPLLDQYDAVFIATCRDQDELEEVAAALRRYFRAVTASEKTLFAIGVAGELDIEVVGARARAIARKLEVPSHEAPDVSIAPIGEDPVAWLTTVPAGRRRRVYDLTGWLADLEPLEDQSPSGFRRSLQRVVQAAS
jgi:GT2 family glycosyltransferase